MRFFSIVTAIVVAIALYGIVFERERLLELAGRTSSTEMPASETAEASEQTAEDMATEGSEPQLVSVVVMESRANTVDNTVTMRGQTEAARQVDVKAQISGLVTSDPLRKGSFVSAGDVLCQLEPGRAPPNFWKPRPD